jgi:hypothetical protein
VHPTIYKILDKYQEHNESLQYDYKKFSEPQLRQILRLNRDEKMTVQELQSNLANFMDKLHSYEDKTKIALCAKAKLARKKHKIHYGNSPDLMMADEGVLKDLQGSPEFTGIIDELPAFKTDIQEAIEATLKNLGLHKDLVQKQSGSSFKRNKFRKNLRDLRESQGRATRIQFKVEKGISPWGAGSKENSVHEFSPTPNLDRKGDRSSNGVSFPDYQV